MTTRAIHLEVSESLETDTFINVLRRFMGRRGYPKSIISDCSTNVVGADNELKEDLTKLNNQSITDHLAVRGITWKCNPPDAPHMGEACKIC